MNKTAIASLVGFFFSSSIFAATDIQTDDVVVTANRFERKDTETTYASEIHTREMIDASGAASLYDYLSQQTSVNVLPSAGNRATPLIDMRGFSAESGYQNIVITVDGQRLNNIDLSSQLLGAIPLGNIDRIEITKGSGSVIYGDGATAGTIQIYTKAKTGVSVSASAGNYGALSGFLSAGIAEQYFDLSASAAHDSNDGYSKKDQTGERDDFTSNTQNVKLKLKPTDSLRFNLEATSSRIDTRYVNPLTLAQFKADPRQVGFDFFGGKTLTHQGLDTDQWRVGGEYDITSKLKISANHYHEDKLSDFITFGNRLNYDYSSNDFALSYSGESLSTIVGIQTFDGVRDSATNSTSKDNSAVFLQNEYRVDAWTFSAGARREKVKYQFAPNVGASQNDSRRLDAWDIGVNYRFNSETSLFANYNQAFQAPDVDRFFLFGGGFNGFIEPAKSKTVNLGLNHVVARNRLKLTAFYIDLSNEIYFNPFTFANTNLDQTHKYGFEAQDYWQINDQLSSAIIYTYTRALIDKERDGAGAFDGKELPGAPKHSINANLNYQPWQPVNINLSHTWRSSSYVIGDFANSLAGRQSNYHSTNLAASYQYKNLQWFATVSNIFKYKNGLFIRSDFPIANDVAVYPSDFSRTWRIGMKADF